MEYGIFVALANDVVAFLPVPKERKLFLNDKILVSITKIDTEKIEIQLAPDLPN